MAHRLTSTATILTTGRPTSISTWEPGRRLIAVAASAYGINHLGRYGRGNCGQKGVGRACQFAASMPGPAGIIELLSLRWYNPVAHQWNLDFATPQVGVLGVPGVGEFKNGRVDFYDQEPINGRSVLVWFSTWDRLTCPPITGLFR